MIAVIKKHEKLAIQFFKYLLVGGTAFIFDFSSLFLLTEYAHIQYLTSAAIAFIIGLNMNYILAKYFVFTGSKMKSLKVEYGMVFFISLTSLALNQTLIWFFTEKLFVYYLYSKMISTCIILIYNFWVRKKFVFD